MTFTDDLAVVRGALEWAAESNPEEETRALAALDRVEEALDDLDRIADLREAEVMRLRPRLAEAERVLREIADLRGHDYPGEAPDMARAYFASREQEDRS